MDVKLINVTGQSAALCRLCENAKPQAARGPTPMVRSDASENEMPMSQYNLVNSIAFTGTDRLANHEQSMDTEIVEDVIDEVALHGALGESQKCCFLLPALAFMAQLGDWTL